MARRHLTEFAIDPEPQDAGDHRAKGDARMQRHRAGINENIGIAQANVGQRRRQA